MIQHLDRAFAGRTTKLGTEAGHPLESWKYECGEIVVTTIANTAPAESAIRVACAFSVVHHFGAPRDNPHPNTAAVARARSRNSALRSLRADKTFRIRTKYEYIAIFDIRIRRPGFHRQASAQAIVSPAIFRVSLDSSACPPAWQ